MSMTFVRSLVVLLVCTTGLLLERANAQSNGDLRLTGGNKTTGWVEIYYDFKWNTISGGSIRPYYDISRVICRQLGLPFTQAARVVNVNLFRPSDSTGVLVTSLICDGDEARLTDCRGFYWNIPFYGTHDNDIGVHCKGVYIQTGDLRLVDGLDRREGRLEIYQGNSWESICSVGFDVTEATVACRQLGLLNSSDVVVYPDAYFGRGNIGDGPYIAHCRGDEERIDSCIFYRSFSSRYMAEKFCGSTDDVGICCPSELGGCQTTVVKKSGSLVGGIVGAIVVATIVLVCCCCCRSRKKRSNQRYTTVVQNPPAQTASGGEQVTMTPAGENAPPTVYYHGSSPGYPAGAGAATPPGVQTYPTQYPPSGPAMPPPAPVAGAPYPSQPNPYPAGQIPPPTAAVAPYPSQPIQYPSGQVPPPTGAYPVPQQSAYNPTAAAGQYPPQPTASYPPQTSSMAPSDGAPSSQPTDDTHLQSSQPSTGDSYPTKGDPDHPLPPQAGGEMPSVYPMDTNRGHDVIPSAPPPAYEHLIG